MTIVRTIFFFSALFFPYIHAHDDIHNHIYQAYPYDVISPKATVILNFAQEIYPPFSSCSSHRMLAEWLMQGVADYSFDNITIIRLANIIESDTTLEKKIAALLIIKTQYDLQWEKTHRMNNLIAGAFFTCFAAMVMLVIRDITKSPTTGIAN